VSFQLIHRSCINQPANSRRPGSDQVRRLVTGSPTPSHAGGAAHLPHSSLLRTTRGIAKATLPCISLLGNRSPSPITYSINSRAVTTARQRNGFADLRQGRPCMAVVARGAPRAGLPVPP
jgi:hypothetical protein